MWIYYGEEGQQFLKYVQYKYCSLNLLLQWSFNRAKIK